MKNIKKYIVELISKSEIEEKKFIIWGYAKCGVWLKELLEEEGARERIAYIIDNGKGNIIGSDLILYRSSILDYINNEKYIVLSTVEEFDEVRKKANIHGFQVLDFRHDIGNSYLNYLQKKNNKINFGIEKRGQYSSWGSENGEHVPFDYVCGRRIFEELCELCEDRRSLFDFGCGKAAALLYAYEAGIRDLGGVELISDIYIQAVHNLKELNIDATILCKDATTVCEEIDKYNIFFFYNPFNGSIFSKVIENIEDSFKRKPRKIWIAYGNPFDHKSVIKNGYFKLVKQIEVDLYDPLFNFYCNDF